MKAAKVTVIGGSGFIGSYFCQLLVDKNCEFEIIDIRKSAKFPHFYKYGDVRDVESLRASISGDVIVNLAAIHKDDILEKDLYYSVNVQGARNIREVCQERNIKRVIFTSSVAVYGFSQPLANEDQQLAPFNDYGRSKKMAEEVFTEWVNSKGRALTIVRPTVVFGEGNRGNVYNLIEQIRRRRFIMIGKGRNKKSMAYVRNVAAFLLVCLDNNQGVSIVNYVDGPDITTNELVLLAKKYFFGSKTVGVRLPLFVGLLAGAAFDLLARILNKKFPISLIRIKKFTSDSTYVSKTKQRLKFLPPFQLEEGLMNTLQSEFPLHKLNK